MTQYNSISKTVEAMQWTGMNWGDLKKWFEALTACAAILVPPKDGVITLQTELMDAEIEPGNWVICNHYGVVFMCDDETFGKSYIEQYDKYSISEFRAARLAVAMGETNRLKFVGSYMRACNGTANPASLGHAFDAAEKERDASETLDPEGGTHENPLGE